MTDCSVVLAGRVCTITTVALTDNVGSVEYVDLMDCFGDVTASQRVI